MRREIAPWQRAAIHRRRQLELRIVHHLPHGNADMRQPRQHHDAGCRKLDPRAFGGGVFLGLNGVVVKAHGSSDALGFASAVDTAIDMAEAGIINRIIADHATVAAALNTGAAAS